MVQSPTERPGLLIVDDDPEIRGQMRWSFGNSFQVTEAGDRSEALARQAEARAPVVILDMGLPPLPDDATEGITTLQALLERDASTKIVVVTGKSDAATAIRALDAGAFDYLNKPVDVEELRVILRRATKLQHIEQMARPEQTAAAADACSFGRVLGSSPAMQKVFSTLRRVCNSDVPALLLGETGTGKEWVARALHDAGPRSKGPFVPINCSAIPDTLIESELFGYEKGAFSGAHAPRFGLLEAASKGTVFLDEIGELPPATQVKLLRFLQDLKVVRVGGREEIPVDVRVIAATNADLAAGMAGRTFREDLYYRLAVVTIELPPLRDRADDVLLLARAFLDRSAAAEKKPLKGFSREAVQAIRSFRWPGNVRQLENHVKRAVVMAEGPWITGPDLQISPATTEPMGEVSGEGTLRAAREAVERDLVRKTLERNAWNVTRSATDLGISRPTLHELIAKHALKR